MRKSLLQKRHQNWVCLPALLLGVTSCLLPRNGAFYAAREPIFPWPPPQPSAHEQIFPNLNPLHRYHTIGEIAAVMTTALHQAGYGNIFYHDVHDGVALVTPLETINQSGASVRHQPTPRFFSIDFLEGYIGRVFSPNRSLYRQLVFACSDITPIVSTRKVPPNTGFQGGYIGLPGEIASRPLTTQHACWALVYQFLRPNDYSEVVFQPQSHLDAREHLVASGLWTHLSKL